MRILRSFSIPQLRVDHPEVDISDILVGDEVLKYSMIIGGANWKVTLNRFDVQLSVSIMGR